MLAFPSGVPNCMDEELSVTGMERPPRWRCRTCGAHGDFSDLVWAFDHVMMEHRRLSADCPSTIQDIYVTGLANLGLGEFYDHNPDVWEPFAKVYKYLLNWRHRQEIIDRTTWASFRAQYESVFLMLNRCLRDSVLPI